jgi:soluble lytic murein transglycosylase-like protein
MTQLDEARHMLFSYCTRLLLVSGLAVAPYAFAGTQAEEPLSASVQAALQKNVADTASPRAGFVNESEAKDWLEEMSQRLLSRIPDKQERMNFLRTVHYEATRAGLQPELVLGLIQVESAFRKYAVSTAGAKGYMQVMPFWLKLIGTADQNLFNLRTNLRYGCTIFRYYLTMEKGDYFRALGRYNGSLGQPDYPTMVVQTWERVWSSAARRADAKPVKTSTGRQG